MLTAVHKINLLCHQLEFSACTLSFPVFKRRGSTDLVVGGGGGGAAPSRRAVDRRRERVATRPDDPAAARTAAARQQALHLLAVQRLLLQDRLALGADDRRRRRRGRGRLVGQTVAATSQLVVGVGRDRRGRVAVQHRERLGARAVAACSVPQS